MRYLIPSREVYNLVARKARVFPTRIARAAWFSVCYKSIEFGWCPPWRHPEYWRQSALWVSRQPIAMLIGSTFMFYSWKTDGFFDLWITTMFTVGQSPPISRANERQQQIQQPWIQEVAGNHRLGRFTNETPEERERRLEIQREQRRRTRQQETAEQREHRLAQRRQRRPQETEEQETWKSAAKPSAGDRGEEEYSSYTSDSNSL